MERGINKVILVGTIGTEINHKITSAGKNMATFQLITNDGHVKKTNNIKTKPISQWHSIICFDPLPKVLSEVMKKDDLVYLEGYINTTVWYDDYDQKRLTTRIVAKSIQKLANKSQIEL
jgi:single-strand DNA-binding protein